MQQRIKRSRAWLHCIVLHRVVENIAAAAAEVKLAEWCDGGSIRTFNCIGWKPTPPRRPAAPPPRRRGVGGN